jgi:DNA-binding CsgD family transcriptional regulator
VLLLADDLSIAAMTPSAERWLTEVAEGDRRTPSGLPSAVYAAAARLQACELGTASLILPRARLRTASGQWLVLHAARLAGTRELADGQIAVTIEVARPVEMTPLIAQAYGLSKRECEVVQLVVRGESTSEIAALLLITPNTVQQHLKAIFDKVGVHSRRELVGQLFAQQYQPRIAAGRTLDTEGWFT